MAKGEVKKLKISPLTLDDKFTREGLEAVSILTDNQPYYLVGGMATQSYIPTTCRRPTSDIDFSIVKPLNYTEFKDFSKPVIEYLKDKGYNVETKARSRAFNLEVENKEGEKLLIEFSRRNRKSFDNSRGRLERELENSKRKIIERGTGTYVVSAPEDIIIPKMVRSVNSLIRNQGLKQLLPKKSNLSEKEIASRLDKIHRYREYAMMIPTDLEFAEELRFVSDIYDIEILSIIAGINLDYFKKASNEWKALTEDNPYKALLFNFIPRMNSD
jgi:hypothetical protein